MEKRMRSLGWIALAAATALLVSAAVAQESPKGPAGANSPAEARALGYLHTVYVAQLDYKKKHGEYARSLAALVGKGSFTRRMASPDRGDYQAHFAGNGVGFSASMTPKNFDAEHRAFFINETGVVRVDPDKPANAQSPPLK